MTETDQEHIQGLTGELEYLVEESGRKLSKYYGGFISEEELLTITDKAVEKYKELASEVAEGVESLEDRNFVDEVKESLEDARYDSIENLAAGRDPIRASAENSMRSGIISPDIDLEFERAFQVIEDLEYLMVDIKNRYNIETSYSGIGEEAEEEMEIMREASKLEGEGISLEESVEELDSL